MEWCSIDEAARRTGVGVEALRKRAQRGADNTRKNEAGRWEYLIPDVVEAEPEPEVGEPLDNVPDRGTQDTTAPPDEALLHYTLRIQRDEIEHLREQLGRRDRIIDGLMDRVPELPAPDPKPQQRRPLWQRLFRT